MSDRITNLVEQWLAFLASLAIGWASRALLWPRWAKRSFVVCGDIVLCVLSTWLAFSLRLGEWRLLDWPVIRFTLSTLLVWFPVAFYQGVYSAIFRYSGRGAIVRLAIAMAIASLPLIFFYLIRTYPGVPRTLALLGPMIFFLAMTVARIVGRYILVDLFHSRPADGSDEKRMLVYGAGSLGQRLAASLVSERGMRLVGYIDDDKTKDGQRLDGMRVWHSERIGEVIARTGASNILLAVGDVSRQRKREILDALREYPVEVQTPPPMRDVLSGRVTASDLRPIEIEDLLGRVPVEPAVDLLALAVSGQSVLVSGAGGSIGSELCRQVIELGPTSLALVDASEFALYAIREEIEALLAKLPESTRPQLHARLCNVASSEETRRLFDNIRPETVFHAAAYKHVPLVEENVLSGVHNNIRGTWNCAMAAQAVGTRRFILISTDKAVRPPNVMGATKRVCEMVLQAMHAEGSQTIFAMVRFGNVLGSSGSVVPLFRRQILQGGPITVTHREVTRYFMTIPEAAQLVLQAAGMAEGGDVFVLDMGEPVKIWDLARTMISLAGMKVREDGAEGGSIEIVERGLRPGEKLYEELLIGDNPLATRHPRILRARDGFLPMEELAEHLARLENAVAVGNERQCRDALRDLVPTLTLSN